MNPDNPAMIFQRHREAVTAPYKDAEGHKKFIVYIVEFEAKWPYDLHTVSGPNGIPYPVLVTGESKRDIKAQEIIRVERFDLA